MKQLTKFNKIIIAIIVALIIIATIITATIGFEVELKFKDSQKIELYLEKEFEMSDIQNITNEVFKNQKVIIQKIEVYEDALSITASEITEDQKEQIINKVNEKYNTQVSADQVNITTVPRLRIRKMFTQYIVPFIIALGIILIYMAIRYFKLGSIKVVGQTLLTIIITQIILFSVIVITRIPLGRITIPMVITVLVFTLLTLTTNYEKKLKKIKEQNNKK